MSQLVNSERTRNPRGQDRTGEAGLQPCAKSPKEDFFRPPVAGAQLQSCEARAYLTFSPMDFAWVNR